MSTAILPPTSTWFVFPAKAHPEPRYGAGIQMGVAGANFHTLVCRPRTPLSLGTGPAGLVIRTKMRLNGFRVRQRPPIRHSREGGNPRTNIPRKNANRDTTTYVHTATPLRLSGESTPRTPIRRRNPEGCVRRQFSYLAKVPNPDTAPESRGVWAAPIFIPWCAGRSRHERLVRK